MAKKAEKNGENLESPESEGAGELQESKPVRKSISIRRVDDISFGLYETADGVETMLMSDLFSITQDHAMHWLQREAGVL